MENTHAQFQEDFSSRYIQSGYLYPQIMEITQSPSAEGSPRMYIYTQEGNLLLKNRRNLFAMAWNEIPDIFLRRKRAKGKSVCVGRSTVCLPLQQQNTEVR